MHKDYRYLFAFSIPLLSLIAILRPDRYAFLPLVFSFVLVPLLDKMIPVNHPSPLSPLEEDERKNNFLFDLFLYACVPLQWGVLLTFLSAAQNPLLNKLEITGMVIATGLCSGIIGINVAHELGHRKNPFDRFCAKLLLLSSLYMHFFIEHNKGHHRRVGTPDDPATGRLGETVYTFILRSVSGSYRSAWQIQRDELRKKNATFISNSNQMLWFQMLQLGLVLIIALLAGFYIALLFLATAFIGILLLEVINYIEHYGLKRRQTYTGQYERVNLHHSWNAEQPIGRSILFELTRHADHHYQASRKYQVLRNLENSPQLPAGYPAMMLLSLIPPIWFRIMNPLARKWNSLS
jgi:alkane 1-monooxygenase